MPALAKPRHEAFARAIVAGLLHRANGDYWSQGRAYVLAGYNCKDAGQSGGSAEAAASRLLKRVKLISERVAELQQEAAARLQPKLDVSLERVGRRLDLASRLAQEAETPMPSAIVAAELGIAKVFGHITDKHQDVTAPRFEDAQSLNDVGIKLLQSVGYASPSPTDVALALEAHAELIAQLEAIAERAQSVTPTN